MGIKLNGLNSFCIAALRLRPCCESAFILRIVFWKRSEGVFFTLLSIDVLHRTSLHSAFFLLHFSSSMMLGLETGQQGPELRNHSHMRALGYSVLLQRCGSSAQEVMLELCLCVLCIQS